MSELTDLQDARTNLAAQIKAVSASPGPNYKIEGQEVDKADYLMTLIKSYKAMDGLIANQEGPDEQLTEMYTDYHPLG